MNFTFHRMTRLRKQIRYYNLLDLPVSAFMTPCLIKKSRITTAQFVLNSPDTISSFTLNKNTKRHRLCSFSVVSNCITTITKRDNSKHYERKNLINVFYSQHETAFLRKYKSNFQNKFVLLTRAAKIFENWVKILYSWYCI